MVSVHGPGRNEIAYTLLQFVRVLGTAPALDPGGLSCLWKLEHGGQEGRGLPSWECERGLQENFREGLIGKGEVYRGTKPQLTVGSNKATHRRCWHRILANKYLRSRIR